MQEDANPGWPTGHRENQASIYHSQTSITNKNALDPDAGIFLDNPQNYWCIAPLWYEIADSPRGNMKLRIIGLAVALLFVSAAVCATQTAHMNTWKLNEAKSHFSKGASKNMIVVYETVGEQIKVTVDGVDGDGVFTHNEWIGKFDGKDYAVTGDPNADSRAYRRLNSGTLAFTNKKDGRITTTGRIVVSANSRSRTVTTTTRDSKGRTVTNIAVYDKQ